MRLFLVSFIQQNVKIKVFNIDAINTLYIIYIYTICIN